MPPEASPSGPQVLVWSVEKHLFKTCYKNIM